MFLNWVELNIGAFMIRQFKEADYLAVQRIYQQGIDTRNATFQNTVKTWDEWDSSMLPHCRLVAGEHNDVLGWAALSSVSSRAVYSGVAEVSLYVANEAKGKGVGQALMSALIVESEKCNIWMLQSAIFPENLASLAVHKNNGFRQLGVREKLAQMDGVWRDVVFMERRSQIVGC